MMTRKRYGKMLIGIALGNLTAILMTPYLFGHPLASVPTRLMAMLCGLGLFALWTWSSWPTNVDDEQE